MRCVEHREEAKRFAIFASEWHAPFGNVPGERETTAKVKRNWENPIARTISIWREVNKWWTMERGEAAVNARSVVIDDAEIMAIRRTKNWRFILDSDWRRDCGIELVLFFVFALLVFKIWTNAAMREFSWWKNAQNLQQTFGLMFYRFLYIV